MCKSKVVSVIPCLQKGQFRSLTFQKLCSEICHGWVYILGDIYPDLDTTPHLSEGNFTTGRFTRISGNHALLFHIDWQDSGKHKPFQIDGHGYRMLHMLHFSTGGAYG